ncbi:CarD family transcriptional regulator [Deinococcus hopiensis]|uniref:Transcriptional regulator, CarD family n=1 Tax=Deinococcus hopiensis KR-140 TaxID=695939 RepID=A0A1W1V6V1_9DEIO|nr:CarD family transcriptional regulator [Deinococcus hopiensis]SMB88724.1 transcriptional regulator, CarD family [Deinococcus hopiensis KR-140]
MKSSSFLPGDRVVLPPYGVGVVCGTCQRPISGETQAYYQVEFANTSSRAFVPVQSPQGAGLRAALTTADMPNLLDCLQNSGALNLPRQWSARHRRVAEILAAADPYELATLTCELRRWNVQRGLPDLDRQAFRQAIRLLEQEVSGLEDECALNVQQFLGHAWNETSQS